MKKGFFIGVLMLSFSIAAQEEESYWQKHFDLNGYVKYMNTNSFQTPDSIYTDNLIHNRINLAWFPTPSLTVKAEVRNRLFWGESVKLNPFYADWIDNDPGEIDMSWNLYSGNSLILNSTLDRAFLEYAKGKWNIRLGRQRINWGINLAWNPNDLFNAYNFVDFDYQERPGSDAIRIQYYNKPMSQLELACKPGQTMDESIIAGLYRFNKGGYDFQFIGGNYFTDLTIGTGWAGGIKMIGFKGEVSYFHPKSALQDTSGSAAASISLDYTFDKGIYLNISGLYNGSASGGNPAMLQTSFVTLSAKNLMPAEFTAFVQVAGAFTPIFGGGLSVMYLPEYTGVFFMPTLNYSIVENWDLDFVGQLFFAESQGKFSNLSNGLFFRIRWSY